MLPPHTNWKFFLLGVQLRRDEKLVLICAAPYSPFHHPTSTYLAGHKRRRKSEKKREKKEKKRRKKKEFSF